MRTLPTSIFIACIVLFLSSTVSWLSFQTVKQRNEEELPRILELPFGKSYFIIHANNNIVGKLKCDVKERDETIDVIGGGELQISFRGQQDKLDFSGNLHVNSLSQVGASRLTIKLGETSIAIGTLQINPIIVRAKFKNKAVEQNFVRQIPGPFIGKRDHLDKLRITYAGSGRQFLKLEDRLNLKIPLVLKQVSVGTFKDTRLSEDNVFVVENLVTSIGLRLHQLIDQIRQYSPGLVPSELPFSKFVNENAE